mgnify:FL=1
MLIVVIAYLDIDGDGKRLMLGLRSFQIVNVTVLKELFETVIYCVGHNN